MSFSITGWLKNTMSNRRGTRRNKPRSAIRTIRSTRLNVQSLEDRVVPAAFIYQLTPYGNSQFTISGTITADGPVATIVPSSAVSSWTVDVTNSITHATSHYS